MLLLTPAHADLIKDIQVLDDIGSDHRPVLFTMPVKHPPTRTIQLPKPDFENADWLSYQKAVKTAMTGAPKISPDKASIDEAVAFLTNVIRSSDLTAIPRRQLRDGRRRRKLPKHIVNLIKRKLEEIKGK